MPNKFIPPQTDTVTRSAATPLDGEVFYDTDEKKLYYGDGTTVGGVAVGAGGGHTIEDEGTPLTQRTNLNFVGGGVTVTDDSGNDRTIVTVPANPTTREVLTANRTYYVRTDGNDSNDGLSDSAGGAFLTIQKAIDVVSTLDISIYDVTISLTGTYTEDVTLKSFIGSSVVTISGGTLTTPSVCCITGLAQTGKYRILNTVFNPGAGKNAISVEAGILIVEGVTFGASNVDIFSRNGARTLLKSYSITGGGYCHYYAVTNGVIERENTAATRTVTLTGTPAFTIFAVASRGGIIDLNNYANSFVFSGSATGSRYDVNSTGIIWASSAGTSYFPGSTQGTVETASYGYYKP